MSEKAKKKLNETKNLPVKEAPHLEATPLKWIQEEGKDKPIVYINVKPGEDKKDALERRCKEIVGVKDTELAQGIIFEASRAIEPRVGSVSGLNTIAQTLNDFQPKDAIEARLAAQASVAFTYAMDAIKTGGKSEIMCQIEAMANLGIKFMRAHNETIETLNRYRRGGVQQVVVHHQNNVVADTATINSIAGVGVISQNRGDSPCQQNAAQSPEPITINLADSQQCKTEDVASTEARAPEPKQKKAASE